MLKEDKRKISSEEMLANCWFFLAIITSEKSTKVDSEAYFLSSLATHLGKKMVAFVRERLQCDCLRQCKRLQLGALARFPWAEIFYYSSSEELEFLQRNMVKILESANEQARVPIEEKKAEFHIVIGDADRSLEST
jgi:hypothetical protein